MKFFDYLPNVYVGEGINEDESFKYRLVKNIFRRVKVRPDLEKFVNSFETYIIEEDRGSGKVCVYGAAAHRVQKGQKIIILSYASIDVEQSSLHVPAIIHVNQNNQVKN